MNIVGYFTGIDPSACLIKEGKLSAFCEEERLLRYKHAPNLFPTRSIEACLSIGGLQLADVDAFAYGWDAPRFTNGEMQQCYERINRGYPPDPGTRAWQARNLSMFKASNALEQLRSQLHRHFGEAEPPRLLFEPHHRSHALTAFLYSPFEEALVFVLDGSGEQHTATLWRGQGSELQLLRALEIPHSLGWFYAALTEYLGFEAYDGEYKVMGLAAYGRPNLQLRARLAEVVSTASNGIDWMLDPKFIHHGKHTFSHRFTDALVEHLGLPPRMGKAPLTPEYEDLAYETQWALEEHVLRFLRHAAQETQLHKLCMAGGVALNIKLNSRIRSSGLFEDVFVFPIPSDSGSAIGAAAGVALRLGEQRPSALSHLYLGPSFHDDEVEAQLQSSGIAYETPRDLCGQVAGLLAEGQVVGWMQGALEAGPRALGARSILADPRTVAARDRVNRAVKFREYWRPFCPSVTTEAAADYFEGCTEAPFMIQAYAATERAKREIPAVVHIDGSVRPQTVSKSTSPLYHRLLESFRAHTGVPVLLNTSFNVKGEAIVTSPRDALRTFYSTGLDALAIGKFLLRKVNKPVEAEPEEVLR